MQNNTYNILERKYLSCLLKNVDEAFNILIVKKYLTHHNDNCITAVCKKYYIIMFLVK